MTSPAFAAYLASRTQEQQFINLTLEELELAFLAGQRAQREVDAEMATKNWPDDAVARKIAQAIRASGGEKMPTPTAGGT